MYEHIKEYWDQRFNEIAQQLKELPMKRETIKLHCDAPPNVHLMTKATNSVLTSMRAERRPDGSCDIILELNLLNNGETYWKPQGPENK